MLLSKSCEYALRAALYVASKKEGQYVSIREIADELDISFHFLTKILQSLTENTIMSSFRGAKGGVMLAKPSRHIRLIDIVKAIDGMDLFKECVLGLPNCGMDKPCSLHDEVVGIREQFKKAFESNTLYDLAHKTLKLNLRITATAKSA